MVKSFGALAVVEIQVWHTFAKFWNIGWIAINSVNTSSNWYYFDYNFVFITLVIHSLIFGHSEYKTGEYFECLWELLYHWNIV